MPAAEEDPKPPIDIIQAIQRLGSSKAIPVLLLGGCELANETAARRIYAVRRHGPFVPIDCASTPAALMKLLKSAHGGTAFFNEVGTLPLSDQDKLLQVLQYREIRAEGHNHATPCVFRVIATNNCDLKEQTRNGKFRVALYYRLDVVTLDLSRSRMTIPLGLGRP